eukprot:326411_1
MTEPSIKSRTSKREYVLKLWNHLEDRINNIMNKKEITFQELTSFMSDSKNIKLTASFFMMLSSYCTKTPIQKHNNMSINTKKAKSILSALMIRKFPNDVLDIADIKDLDPSSEACYNCANT